MKPSDLHFLLFLNKEDGSLFWKERPFFLFPSNSAAVAWNGRYAGQIAFDTPREDGYLSGSIFGKKYLAHRVVWAMVYGEWPSLQIDHINGSRSDNRPINLREVSAQDNNRNLGLSSRNKSGVAGVYFNKMRKTWVAQITEDGKTKNLGSFQDINDAITRRKEAERQMGFHPNHGRRPAGECAAHAEGR